MIHALSETGRRALRDAASQLLLYAFDFDGTLAPISRDRHAVTVSDSTLQSLGEMAKRAPCARASAGRRRGEDQWLRASSDRQSWHRKSIDRSQRVS